MLSKQCVVCNETYSRKKNTSYKEWGKSKFCSIKCKNNENKIRVFCIICKKDFIINRRMNQVIKTCKNKSCRSKYRKTFWNDKRKKQMSKNWRGNRNPRWQPIGSKVDDGHGYILVKIKEGQDFDNWRQEHVYVMEKHIKRKIDTKKECVHHIDGDKKNNKLSNLFLTTHNYHKKLHQSIFMELIKPLLEKNIINFDKNSGTYKLTFS